MRTIADQVAAYLDGDLTPAETRALEREMLRPEVSQALAEELALRELLQGLPLDAPPEGLETRIVAALGVEERRPLRERLLGGHTSSTSSAPTSPRTPNYAATGLRAGTSSWLAGLGTLRYAAGPLAGVARASGVAADRRADEDEAPLRPKRRVGRALFGAAVSAYRVASGAAKRPLLVRALGLGRAR